LFGFCSLTRQPSKNHLVYHFNYPSSPADSLTLNGVFARDAVNVGDEQGTPPVFPMVDMNGLLNGESGTALAQGTTGFWGLGVDPVSQPVATTTDKPRGSPAGRFCRTW
jgi:hypothetical protein